MFRELTDEGIVFRVGRFREIDCWVRFFTPSLGLVTAFAFGGAKSRRRFCGCLDVMNRVLFKVRHFPVKGYYCLEEGALLQGYPRLRGDTGRQGLAVNCMQFVQALQADGQSAPALHALLRETLDALDRAEHVPALFAQCFRARVCFDHGFAPSLDRCARCGLDIAACGALVALDDGRAFCPGCAQNSAPAGSSTARLGPEAHGFVRLVAESGPGQWCAAALSRAATAEVSRLAEAYVQRHLGLRWHQGRFVAG